YELSAAEAELRSADFRHNSTLQEVALSTQKAYYELLTSKALLDVAEETVEQRRRHVRLAERQAEAGRAREVEVLQAKARLSEAEFDRVDARNQVRQTRGRLNVIMGLPPNHPLEIKEMPDEVTEEEVEDVEKLMDLASEQRPSLKSAAEQVERWRDLVHAEKRRRLPNINTDLSYGWKDTKAVPEREEYSMSAGLNLPLFTGFQTTYGIRNAKARLQSAIREYEENLRQVEQEVWDAFSEVVRAKESVKVAESYVKSTRESQKVAERGYEEGRATIVELIDAQTELTQALARQHRSRLQWYSSIAALERAVGEILSEQQNSE
ncbi:MAG: TolC family protein, partial [Planctomycetota bacterium]